MSITRQHRRVPHPSLKPFSQILLEWLQLPLSRNSWPVLRPSRWRSQIPGNRRTMIPGQEANRPNAQSLPFKLNYHFHVAPLEHMRPSSASRIRPADDRPGVAHFSTGTMLIFAPALTPGHRHDVGAALAGGRKQEHQTRLEELVALRHRGRPFITLAAPQPDPPREPSVFHPRRSCYAISSSAQAKLLHLGVATRQLVLIGTRARWLYGLHPLAQL